MHCDANYSYQAREWRFFILEETLFSQDGYDMLRIFNFRLLIIGLFRFTILYLIGYFMAKSAFKPVSKIIKQVNDITASNLSKRVTMSNSNDEISELASAFNTTLNRLEKSFESQKMFVSHISHELRTPIAVLIAELELSLRKKRDNADYVEVIENALSDARNIEHLSVELFNLAKAVYNVHQISITEVRIDEVLMESYGIVLKANRSYKIDLYIDDLSDDDRTITVHVKAYLLQTAFVNLMENGCKFSPDHTTHMEVAFSSGQIRISFRDKGVGIPQEDIFQLFTPFYRGSNKNYTSGHGIGLILVDKIITLHGGSIEVDSKVGEGELLHNHSIAFIKTMAEVCGYNHSSAIVFICIITL